VRDSGSLVYDLTDIPAAYDRGRDHGPEVLDLWMNAIAAHVEGQSVTRILDLGCGTGRFSQGLAQHFNADVIGIDPSIRMLQQARAKRHDPRVRYQPARAETLPLRPQSVDLVFLSMSFHHFADPDQAARECRRVLREPGCLFVRTGTREQIRRYPYVPFFPSSWPLLEQHLPDSTGLRTTFEAAGFDTIALEVITQTIAPDWSAYAEKLAAGADSILARLTPQDFDAGLAALRRHGADVGRQAIVEPIDLFVFR
jgi:ubiquinone/menaquinone biosynthesis C-methylase UbiE